MSGLHDSIADSVGRGTGKLTFRGRQFRFRWGIDPDCVVWTAAQEDPFLAVRRVYERAEIVEWHRTGSGGIGRIGSRARLGACVRALAQGEIAGAGDSYIEILPWREDGNYPDPGPFPEAFARAKASASKE